MLVVRRLSLQKGYIKKAELVKMALDSHPEKLKALIAFQTELKEIGLEVKWRSRGLATADDAKKMVQKLAENVDHLQRAFN